MMTGGGLWLRHGLAFGAGLAVLFGAGEGGVALFAGLKSSPLVWHLVIGALAVVLATLTYAGVMHVMSGTALLPVLAGALGLVIAGFAVMTGLIYAGLTPWEALVPCALGVFAFGGLRMTRR